MAFAGGPMMAQLNAGLVALLIFRGSGPVAYCLETLLFYFSGGPAPCPQTSGSTHESCSMSPTQNPYKS